MAERLTIAMYNEIITSLGGGDPTSRPVLEIILAMEAEPAKDMLDLLDGLKWSVDSGVRSGRERAKESPSDYDLFVSSRRRATFCTRDLTSR